MVEPGRPSRDLHRHRDLFAQRTQEEGRALARAGRTVEFIPRREGYRLKSLDIIMDGVEWEMKAPKASGQKAFDRVLRRAVHQSHNVIIDAIRITGSSDVQIDHDLRKVAM